MLLGLSKIIDCPGQSVSFSTEVDLRDLRFGTCEPLRDPVLASGTVRNTAGVLMMKGMIQTRLYGVCDRCASEFERDIEFPIDVVLVTELANEDNEDEWVFPLEGDSANLEEIVRTADIPFSIPSYSYGSPRTLPGDVLEHRKLVRHPRRP